MHKTIRGDSFLGVILFDVTGIVNGDDRAADMSYAMSLKKTTSSFSTFGRRLLSRNRDRTAAMQACLWRATCRRCPCPETSWLGLGLQATPSRIIRHHAL